MGVLTAVEVIENRLLHGHTFSAVCDKCGHLIFAGDLYIVKDWAKRPDNLKFLGPIAKRTTCYDTVACERRTSATAAAKEIELITERKPRTKQEKKLALKAKLTDTPIEPAVRRAIIRTLRDDTTTKFDTKLLVIRLLRQKSMREHKKSVLRATIKGMRVKKELRRKAGVWMLLIKEKES